VSVEKIASFCPAHFLKFATPLTSRNVTRDGCTLLLLDYTVIRGCVSVAEKVEAPTLTRTPTDKEVREGQKVRFDAAAKGLPKPAIKWYAWLLLHLTE